METVNRFRIGADPEYAAFTKAGAHLNVKEFTTKDHVVGWDHNGDVLEVKPEPSRYAFRIVRRIQRLLLADEVSKVLIKKGTKFRAGALCNTGGRTVTLGGHIHFGIPFTNPAVYAQYEKAHIIPGRDKMDEGLSEKLKALSKLTTMLEHLDILPTKEASARRDAGEIEVIRCANTDNHFEYRTMCSWLHSPITAHLCLTTAKIAVAHPDSLETVERSMRWLEDWVRRFAAKDIDASRLIERVFEKKLKLEAKLEGNLLDNWQSLTLLGGSKKNEVGTALQRLNGD